MDLYGSTMGLAIPPNMQKQGRETLVYLAIFIASGATGIAIFFATRSVAGLFVCVVLVAAGLLLLVRWHARTFAYRCLGCCHEFEISLWADLISPHGMSKQGGWKYLRCPACGRRTKASIIHKLKGKGTR
jgi:DNA-directed RNA polymerase subunit RPC12/RpoP